jgi:hypothetical protein
VYGGQLNDIGGDLNFHYANNCECWLNWCLLEPCCDHSKPVSVFDILEQHTAVGAAYNSRDRESEHASACQKGTRENVLGKISA